MLTVRKRLDQLEEGKKLYSQGKMTEALFHFRQATSVSEDMIRSLLQMLISMRIAYIVAPYEADAQMAYLCRTGMVDAVITEDSDLMCFRCPCTLYKMTPEGTCRLVRMESVFADQTLGMDSWTCDQFELMCVLSGCDYLDSLPRIGLKTAKKYVASGRYLTAIFNEISRNPKHLPKDLPGGFQGYRTRLDQALACFHHQVIFDPLTSTTKYLTAVTPLARSQYCKEGQPCVFGELIEDSKAARDRARGYENGRVGKEKEKETGYVLRSVDTKYMDEVFGRLGVREERDRYGMWIDINQPLFAPMRSTSSLSSSPSPTPLSSLSTSSTRTPTTSMPSLHSAVITPTYATSSSSLPQSKISAPPATPIVSTRSQQKPSQKPSSPTPSTSSTSSSPSSPYHTPIKCSNIDSFLNQFRCSHSQVVKRAAPSVSSSSACILENIHQMREKVHISDSPTSRLFQQEREECIDLINDDNDNDNDDINDVIVVKDKSKDNSKIKRANTVPQSRPSLISHYFKKY